MRVRAIKLYSTLKPFGNEDKG